MKRLLVAGALLAGLSVTAGAAVITHPLALDQVL